MSTAKVQEKCNLQKKKKKKKKKKICVLWIKDSANPNLLWHHMSKVYLGLKLIWLNAHKVLGENTEYLAQTCDLFALTLGVPATQWSRMTTKFLFCHFLFRWPFCTCTRGSPPPNGWGFPPNFYSTNFSSAIFCSADLFALALGVPASQ